MNNGKVLVLGGAGYIGSHTTIALANHGYEPVIIDNFYNADPRVLSGLEEILGYSVPIHFVDVKNYNELAGIIRGIIDIKGIIHFAAYKYVNESLDRPFQYFGNNINSLLNALQLAVDFHIPGFIFSSSCTVYGEPEQVPVTEAHPRHGRATNPYGKTKEIGESICEDVALRYHNQIKVISLRYFNPVGAHPSGLLGELPTRETQNLVPIILEVVRGERESIKIMGTDYPTVDGTCVRDFIHVMDVASAHVSALEYSIQSEHQEMGLESFNIGTGKGTSVKQIIEGFQELNNYPLQVELGPRRDGDIPEIFADTRKAKKVLGWQSSQEVDKALIDAFIWTQYYLNKYESRA